MFNIKRVEKVSGFRSKYSYYDKLQGILTFLVSLLCIDFLSAFEKLMFRAVLVVYLVKAKSFKFLKLPPKVTLKF